MPKDNTPAFTVTDRRKFTLDGEVRPDAPTEESEPEKVQPTAPPPPPVEAAPKASAPVPEAAAEKKSKTASAPAPDHPETGYDAEKMRSAFGGQKIEFMHLLDMLVQTAMMYAGAMESGPERRVDIVGLRQMIDMISVLEEKTRGNLDEQEQAVMSNTLFQLRMTYMEIVNMIEKQAQNGPGAPGGPKK